jgi:hypothetical protein
MSRDSGWLPGSPAQNLSQAGGGISRVRNEAFSYSRSDSIDRLSRYEATLWRKVGQILFTLDALDRRKPRLPPCSTGSARRSCWCTRNRGPTAWIWFAIMRARPSPGMGKTGERCMKPASQPRCLLSNQPNIRVGRSTTAGSRVRAQRRGSLLSHASARSSIGDERGAHARGSGVIRSNSGWP